MVQSPQQKSVAEIHDEVTSLLRSDAGQAKLGQLGRVLDKLEGSREKAAEAFKWIRRRPEVAFFTNVSQASGREVTLDVRIRGQRVGAVVLKERFTRTFEPKFDIQSLWQDERTDVPWEDKAVRSYLERCADHLRGSSQGEREAAAEAVLLKLMADSTPAKPEPLRETQPALYAGIPIRLPLPIAGREDTSLAKGYGYPDVIGRRDRGGRGLAVFEVKKKDARDVNHALEQAVTYVATLDVMRASDIGQRYWNMLGYSGPMDQKRFEAVAVVDHATDVMALRAAAGALREDTLPGYSLRALAFKLEDGDVMSLEEIEL